MRRRTKNSVAAVFIRASIGLVAISGCGHMVAEKGVGYIDTVKMSSRLIDSRVNQGDTAFAENDFVAAVDNYQFSLSLLATLKQHEAESPDRDSSMLQWIQNRESIVQAKLDCAILGTEIKVFDRQLVTSGPQR